MTEYINDNYILLHCIKRNGKFNPYSINDENIRIYLEQRYNDIPINLFSYKEVFYRIKSNIDCRPVCEICGSPVKFKDSCHYSKYCSKQCVSVSNKNNMLNIWKNRVQEDREIILQKSKQTCLFKYGVEFSFQSENNKIKSDISRQNKYGDKNYYKIGSDSFKEKMKLKYGVEFPLSNNVVRQKISKSLSSEISLQKMRLTCLERYNVLFISQSDIILTKINETFKANNSYNTSKDENLLYKMLIDIYGVNDVIRSYKSENYPFRCDFYISSLDLYIEYNGSMFHNKRLFNPDRDKQELYNISLKVSVTSKPNRYNSLIETWTKRDILKWETAVNNKLNMLFLYPYFHNQWRYLKTHLDNKKLYDEILLVIKTILSLFDTNNKVQLKIGEYNV